MSRRSALDQVAHNIGRKVVTVAKERGVPVDLLEGVEFDDDDPPPRKAGKRTQGAQRLGGLAFSYPDADRNQACACAAYRAVGAPGDVVARHKSGVALFGSFDECKAWAQQHGLIDDSEWEVEDDGVEILRAPYDEHALEHVVRILGSSDKLASDKRFSSFHWGVKPPMPTAVEIPGITGTLTLLGVARRIDYGSDKGGAWDEYYHHHGEEDGNFPMVLQLNDNTYVVHGPHLSIKKDGIHN